MLSSLFKSVARVPVASCAGLMIALLCVSPLSATKDTVQAADLQTSTDRAAVEAKRELCIELNQGAASPELEQAFFAFYEGKIVSAKRLHPETFQIGQIGPLPPIRVVQVLGPAEMLASIESGVFKLKGSSTADVADGQTIRLTDFFFVRDTERYDTVVGSTKTVYVLEQAAGKLPQVKPSRVYPWYNKKNEVAVDGEFKGINGFEAIFSVGGQESSVPLSKFTRGDRELLRIIAKRYPQANPQEKSEKKPLDEPAEKSPARPIGLD